MRLAAIDIGTNSVHMILVRVRPDFSFEIIDREKEMVRLGAGAMCVYVNRRTDVVVDITGWIGAGGASTAVVTPTRIVDTRPGESQALPVTQQRLPGGWILPVDVASLPGVGADGSGPRWRPRNGPERLRMWRGRD